MRINVYEEEMGEGFSIIHKDNVNGSETFYGLRIWLKSPKEILDHSTPEDDDRSAITFWCRDRASLWEFIHDMRLAFQASDGVVRVVSAK